MHWMDVLKFEPLVERLDALDREIDALRADFASFDPLTVLEDLDAVIGEGFLLCQLYMIERKGELEPAVAYACGPPHRALYVAQVINAAGNFHKHRGEWPEEPRWKPQQRATATVIRNAGVSEPEFWLFHLLSHLTDHSRLAELVPMLVTWREALDQLPLAGAAPALALDETRTS